MTKPERCSRCGRRLDYWDVQEDFRIHKEKLGYGTKFDGDAMNLQFCCYCIEELVDACVVSPIVECDSDPEVGV